MNLRNTLTKCLLGDLQVRLVRPPAPFLRKERCELFKKAAADCNSRAEDKTQPSAKQGLDLGEANLVLTHFVRHGR
jgi:hypothetical protein